MKVSIITVVKNGEQTIEEAIQSVINQSYKNIEYLIIDGLSTDNTRTIVDKYKGYIQNIISERDNGIYDAMNKGIDMSTGEIVGILNSDDVLGDDTVIKQIVDIFNDDSIDACFGNLLYVDRYNTNNIKRYWKSHDYNESNSPCDVPPHPTFYCRKKIYDKYGLYDLSYSLAADFDLLYRYIHKYNIKTYYLDKTIVKMKEGGITNRSIKNIIKQNIQIIKSLNENNSKCGVLKYLSTKLYDRIRQYRVAINQ